MDKLEPIGDPTPATTLTNRWRVAPFGDVRLAAPSSTERPIVVSLFGDQSLDLRSTTAAELNIVSVGIMGDLDVKVRPGTRVVLDGVTLFGDIEDESDSRVTDSQTIVRIVRYSLFGDIEVEVDDV